MSTKEKIDYLRQDIKRLEELVNNSRNAEVFPVSFFSHTFDLTHKILNDLHALEEEQVEMMRKQMEERRTLLQSISLSIPVREQPKPEPPTPEIKTEEAEPIVYPQETAKHQEETKNDIQEILTTAEEIIIEETLVVQENEEQTEEEIIQSSEEIRMTEVTSPGKSIEELLAAHRTAPTSLPEKPAVSLIEVLEKKNLSDFRKAFSLNDRFYFRRELFSGDEAKMNQTISDLNELQTLEESMQYLNDLFTTDPEEEAFTLFVQLLEKRFL